MGFTGEAVPFYISEIYGPYLECIHENAVTRRSLMIGRMWHE
jgi:hypothetical protein